MHGVSQPDDRELHVAVVGGGASGTLAAVQLLRTATDRQVSLHVTMIDRHGRHGLGQAYSTKHPAHLLNAMAGQMSALPGDPEHLLRWAARVPGQAVSDKAVPDRGGPDGTTDHGTTDHGTTDHGTTDHGTTDHGTTDHGATRDRATTDAAAGSAGTDRRRLGEQASRRTVTDTTFLSRQEYGRYLLDTLADAEREALAVARLSRIRGEVVAIRRQPAGRPVRLILAGRAGELEADIAIVATGNAPARLPFDVPPTSRVIADPWLPGALDPVAADAARGASVVIVGTGLTMIDLAVMLTDGSPAAKIHAVSRHGLLPRTHPGTRPANRQLWLPVISRTTGPVRLTELMWQVRSTVNASPANWQAVMEALRPYVPGLWRRMPERDKRLFLRHVARYWEVHRHLIPPVTASRITALRGTGQLRVHRGRVSSVTDEGGRLRVQVADGANSVELSADWLINSTGSTADVRATASPLLRDLFDTGLARPDSVGLGIDADGRGAVIDAAGQPSDVVFALGPPLRGVWYETTAIPEIREQAAVLARRITGDRQVRRPGAA
jgi:uncharacterized NAD(P)/FAD-binding protein YdhS